MTHYIDGFILPVQHDQLVKYKEVVQKVAEIWKEHGALDYLEYVSDDSSLEGTRSFSDIAKTREGEVVVFGWVSFESREARDLANERVAADPRMKELINPLTRTSMPIFEAKRMGYGGFRSLVQSSNQSGE